MCLAGGIDVIPAEIVLAKFTPGFQDNEGKRKTPALARPKLGHSQGRTRARLSARRAERLPSLVALSTSGQEHAQGLSAHPQA